VDPTTASLWLTDVAHHHLAIAVLFIIAGHMYRTNFGIGHSMKEILEAHKGPFTGAGHKGLYEVLTTSWHAQLAINLAMLGSLTIIIAHHMYAMPPYHLLSITQHNYRYSHIICGLELLYCRWSSTWINLHGS
jgi:photosystem I P700 chlorophyll a apoprotein A1